jgi:hypothetical protein
VKPDETPPRLAPRSTLVVVSPPDGLPAHLTQRLAAEAKRRGLSVDEVAAGALVIRRSESYSEFSQARDGADVGSRFAGQRELFDAHEGRLLAILVGVIAVFVVFLVVVVSGLPTTRASTSTPTTIATVTVPYEADQAPAGAVVNGLRSLSLNVVTTRRDSLVVARGEVVSESPSSGMVVSVGSTVKLVISAGAHTLQLPRP